MKLLISKGANANVKNDFGVTPLMFNEQHQHKEEVTILKKSRC